MEHAWCLDVARDAAVRAAEDGRDRPLPTLGEAIVLAFGFDKASAQRACDEVKWWPEDVQKDCGCVLGDLLEQGVERLQALVEAWRYGKGLLAARYPDMIPKSVSATSTVEQENKGVRMTKSDRQAADYRAEAQSGMRTERVVLEITHSVPVAQWNGEAILETDRPGESVRVVEEIHFDDLAQVAMERDAAIRERDAAIQRADRDSVKCSALADNVIGLKARVAELEAASGGGEGEPDAFGVMRNGNVDSVIHRAYRNQAEESAKHLGGTVVHLYSAPPQPRGWLTEEERKWIEYMKGNCVLPYAGMACMEAILARSSPLEQPRGWLTEEERVAVEFLASLDAPPCVDAARKAARIGKDLLARSSPPEVVHPAHRGAPEIRERDSLWIRAIAAAGVAVKEGT